MPSYNVHSLHDYHNKFLMQLSENYYGCSVYHSNFEITSDKNKLTQTLLDLPVPVGIEQVVTLVSVACRVLKVDL